ncbi:MAG: Gmad2 immunoglobulin-like domain-containing protein [Candidatus Saccharibacteria bacterium]
MNNKYIRILILLIVAAAIIYFVPQKAKSPTNSNNSKPAEITDFRTCADAGFPVLETMPAQCAAPDGRVFVDDTQESEVVVDSPTFGATVSSPLRISGRARGSWFFEASLPATLKDENGKVLAQSPMRAQGDWMTGDFVNFSGSLEFEQPATEYGVLIIEKDNPSGLPQNDAAFVVPVKFR